MSDLRANKQKWLWELEQTFQSTRENGHAAIETLMKALEDHGWEGRDCFHVHMAIEEAVINAIEHGNREDSTKSVSVHFRVAADLIEMRIADQGSGFDPKVLPDPTELDHLEQPRGRGVMLIKELMTEVHYNSKGNCVTMIKERSGETSDAQ